MNLIQTWKLVNSGKKVYIWRSTMHASMFTRTKLKGKSVQSKEDIYEEQGMWTNCPHKSSCWFNYYLVRWTCQGFELVQIIGFPRRSNVSLWFINHHTIIFHKWPRPWELCKSESIQTGAVRFCLGNQIPKYFERGKVIERSEGGGSGTWLSAQWKTRVSLPLAARTSSGIRASKLPLAKWCEPPMCAWRLLSSSLPVGNKNQSPNRRGVGQDSRGGPRTWRRWWRGGDWLAPWTPASPPKRTTCSAPSRSQSSRLAVGQTNNQQSWPSLFFPLMLKKWRILWFLFFI